MHECEPRARAPAAPPGLSRRTIITAEMIGAVCNGCSHCCRCNLPPKTLAAVAAAGSAHTPFTYFLPHRECVGCGRTHHKKMYDLSRISIPLAVSFEFHEKFMEILSANPTLSQSEAIGVVLISHAPPLATPPPLAAIAPPARRRPTML